MEEKRNDDDDFDGLMKFSAERKQVGSKVNLKVESVIWEMSF